MYEGTFFHVATNISDKSLIYVYVNAWNLYTTRAYYKRDIALCCNQEEQYKYYIYEYNPFAIDVTGNP